jgi:hypothetical protein
MPAVSLGTTGVAELCNSSAYGSSPAPSCLVATPDRFTAPRAGASCRGGRSAFGWPHPGNGVASSLQTVRGGGRAPVSR